LQLQTCFLFIYIYFCEWKGFTLKSKFYFAGGSEQRLIDAATAQLKKLPFYHSFWNRTTKPSLVFISISYNLLNIILCLLIFFIYNLLLYYFFLSSALPYYTRDPTHWINQKMNWINRKVDCRKQMNYFISILIFY
jgi:hypothetical protein